MRKFIVGNWKMNQTKAQITSFFQELERSASLVKHCEAWLAPQFVHLDFVKNLAIPLGMQVGAQNCASETKGAFTGEVSPAALADMGYSFVIVGHSERRALYGEDNSVLNHKVHAAFKEGLTVIFCCGETLEERERGEATSVVRTQMIEGLKGITEKEVSHLMVAYEPVWAIGTGRTATPEQAQEMHAVVRHVLLDELKLSTMAKNLPILYGGSVKPSNIDEILKQPDINGALVGGASLLAPDYLALCKAALS